MDSANAMMANLDQSGRDAATSLFDLEAKARDAGMKVDTLTNAAATGNPIIMGIAGAYGAAANEAQRLAINARQAAIAVAQGKIIELQGQRETINESEARRVKSMNPFVAIPAGITSTVKDIGGELGMGPTRLERQNISENLKNQIDIENRKIKLLKQMPDAACCLLRAGGH